MLVAELNVQQAGKKQAWNASCVSAKIFEVFFGSGVGAYNGKLFQAMHKSMQAIGLYRSHHFMTAFAGDVGVFQ